MPIRIPFTGRPIGGIHEQPQCCHESQSVLDCRPPPPPPPSFYRYSSRDFHLNCRYSLKACEIEPEESKPRDEDNVWFGCRNTPYFISVPQ